MRIRSMYHSESGVGEWIRFILVILIHITTFSESNATHTRYNQQVDPLLVKKCSEFKITGKGDSPEWNRTEWSTLPNWIRRVLTIKVNLKSCHRRKVSTYSSKARIKKLQRRTIRIWIRSGTVMFSKFFSKQIQRRKNILSTK